VTWPFVQCSYAQAEYAHLWARSLSDDHDRISCPCCCMDCEDTLGAQYVWTASDGAREAAP
jgi:hypothetical protein